MKTVAIRLKPGADLKESIEKLIAEHDIRAGFIITCVGGLQQTCVRMAGAKPDAQDIRTMEGNFEIVSLVGTLSTSDMHVHMSFSDTEGTVRGGHLKEGTIIHPTAEIVVGIDESMSFTREMDDETGFKELVISEHQ